MALLIYIDNVIVVTDALKLVCKTKGHLYNLFKIKDQGELKYFLGLEAVRSKQEINYVRRNFHWTY